MVKTKITNKNKTFTPQPYPLYAWGSWAEPVFNDEFTQLVGFEYHKDRLTVVGWLDVPGQQVEPMVMSTGYGVLELREFSGPWPAINPKEDIYTYREDSHGQRVVIEDDFVLVDIAMAEPDDSVFVAANRAHLSSMKLRNKVTVVEEEPEDGQ
jgi:hypothetical protein